MPRPGPSSTVQLQDDNSRHGVTEQVFPSPSRGHCGLVMRHDCSRHDAGLLTSRRRPAIRDTRGRHLRLRDPDRRPSRRDPVQETDHARWPLRLPLRLSRLRWRMGQLLVSLLHCQVLVRLRLSDSAQLLGRLLRHGGGLLRHRRVRGRRLRLPAPRTVRRQAPVADRHHEGRELRRAGGPDV